jgi:hypothetical protein
MEGTIEQQNTKTFIWGMVGADFIEKFERFNKLALVKGKHVTNLLSELVLDHVENQDIEGTLVDEKQLLDELQKADLSVSRVTLRNYRINDKLVRNGKPIYFTDGRNICYHLEHCLEFFRNKKYGNGSPSLTSSK